MVIDFNTNRPCQVDTPYYWMTPEQKERSLIICRNNWYCPYKKQCQKVERWTGWKLLPKTIKAFGSTLNLAEGCNIYRVNLLREVCKAQIENTHSPNFKPCQLPMDAFVKVVRVGSHREWIETTPKHGFHRIVEEYTTKFHDCLPGKEWLKAHYQDKYPEMTIELSVNGKTLSLNGDYKKGTIKEFVKANK